MGFGLFLVAVIIVAALALNGEPGTANLTWLGWRVDTTAAAAVLIIGFLALDACHGLLAGGDLASSPRRRVRPRHALRPAAARARGAHARPHRRRRRRRR